MKENRFQRLIMRSVVFVAIFSLLMISFLDRRTVYAKQGSENNLQIFSSQLTRQQRLLYEKFDEQDTLPIIVQIDTSFRPGLESLDSKSAETQQAAIKSTQEALLFSLKEYKLDLVHSFQFIPFMAMHVDRTAFEALTQSKLVTNIEEDIVVKATLTESVPLIQAPLVWDMGYTGTGQAVAILDTGVDKTHPMLSGKIVSEACYSTNGDDTYSLCPGGVSESTANNSAMPYLGICPIGKCDHGTHVSGIAAGTIGVAKNSKIIAIQVFHLDSGNVYASWSDIIKGLERVYELRNTYSISAVNLSLGVGNYMNNCDSVFPSFKAIVDSLRVAGIATVAASGNDEYISGIAAPACISSVISVGATTKQDEIAFYSNSAGILDLLAPGSYITSAIPGGGTAIKSGTSMSAPHVTGAWAVLKSYQSDTSVSTMLDVFKQSGVPITDYRNGITKPRIDVWYAFNRLPPNPPLNLTISRSGENQLSLYWIDNSWNEDSYKIERSNDGVNWTEVISVGPNVTNYTNYNLAYNTHYWYRVRAHKSLVGLPYSRYSNTVDAWTYPTATPANLSVSRSGDNQLSLTWTDRATNETGYRIERSTNGLNWTQIASVGVNATQYTNYQLEYNTRYWYRVRAYNASGNSMYSNEANEWTYPTASPANLSVSRSGDNQLSLTWTDRATNETGYRIERSTNGLNWTQIASVGVNATQYTNYQLEYNTRYWYRVRAYNASGNSMYSNEANEWTYPTASPANLSVSRSGDNQLSLTWTDRATNETGYRIERSTNGLNWTQIASVGVNATQYTNYQLEYNTRYWYRVRAYNASGNSMYSNEANEWTYPTASPANLSVSRSGDNQLSLTWTDRATNETGYRIERSTNGLNWTQIASVGVNATQYTNYQLEYNTRYWYRVRAYNASGNSMYSNEANEWTYPTASPANLSVSRSGDNQLSLTWTDRATNETGYRIERSTNGLNWTQIASVGVNATQYTNYQLEYNTRYWYRVRAYNASGNSMYSNEANEWTYPTASPANLSVSRSGDNQLSLTWTDRATNETGYRIERSTNGLNWTQIASVGVNATQYTNYQLEYNTRYWYRVRAYNASGNSMYSNEANEWTYPTASPANLSVSRSGDNQLSLTWTDRATNETGYRIERSTNGLNWTQIASVGVNATQYTNYQLEYNTRYWYRVRAYNASGNSMYSNEANEWTYPTASPANLSVSRSGDNQLSLTWTDRATNETGYRIERSTNGLNWTQIASVGVNATQYTNYQLEYNTRYWYRVRAYNASGNSMYSNEASEWTASLAPPLNVSAVSIKDNQIIVEWEDQSNNETGFKLERSIDNTTWTQIATLEANSTNYTNFGLDYNLTYWYRMRSTNENGNSSYSNIAFSKTFTLPSPDNLSGSLIGDNQIELRWNDRSENENGFKIERSVDGIQWIQIATLSADSTSYTNFQLSYGSRYHYRIRGFNELGESSYSNSVSIWTNPDPDQMHIYLPMIIR